MFVVFLLCEWCPLSILFICFIPLSFFSSGTSLHARREDMWVWGMVSVTRHLLGWIFHHLIFVSRIHKNLSIFLSMSIYVGPPDPNGLFALDVALSCVDAFKGNNLTSCFGGRNNNIFFYSLCFWMPCLSLCLISLAMRSVPSIWLVLFTNCKAGCPLGISWVKAFRSDYFLFLNDLLSFDWMILHSKISSCRLPRSHHSI